MHSHTSPNITFSHFSHRQRERWSLKRNNFAWVPQKCNSSRHKTSAFLTFPIDSAATSVETHDTKTTRKQSATPRPPRKKTRTLRDAFGNNVNEPKNIYIYSLREDPTKRNKYSISLKKYSDYYFCCFLWLFFLFMIMIWDPPEDSMYIQI